MRRHRRRSPGQDRLDRRRTHPSWNNSGYLDKCGPTQHFIGHERAVVDGDHASVTAKMRVHHIGADRPDLTFEVFGWHHAEAARTPESRRIVSWRQEVTHEVGTYEVFGRK
ncbi:nuclear transport factor 2 family protein [Nocardia yamanashiensis]|uniref:nuclear transport factor 2 family protein n=1 Tax=Nocardia yamanashiensis TaxID=209247 RepID=UPI0038CDC6D0